ncbi:J domain-containing protein [Sphingopyxis sp. BSN-002]|uniref:DnaJ C-terminal domain-containing protein n=1 Tax=Sphingopyxis sp. BSN-002 TaxID=2911495 RepID=UPI001EDA15B6|nr:J domain-containing protein [Sphingopyxis sp. BSN-002]UKK84296.1 J domain-containing protein [Sphingopyxis sp. BSN-002]
MADPYTTLGVSKSATEAEIKSAYRKLAKELHPDKNKDNPKASEKFSDVTKAYDLLSDKTKRGQFDRGEIDGEGNPAMPFGYGGGGFRGDPRGGQQGGFGGFGTDGADFGDIFEGLFGGRGGGGGGPFGGFGGRSAPPAKGANVAYRLSVSFVDAATQAMQRITLADGKTIDLKLPAGVETGTQMRLAGKGQAGPGGNGDGIVTITVKDHPFYEREGDNIRLDLPITLNEAVKGAKVKVPTVDGPVMLSIPAGSTSGKVMRLKGKGFSQKSGGRGDQLVRLMIDLPAEDAELAKLVEAWSDPRAVRADLGV